MKLIFEETKDIKIAQDLTESTGKGLYKISGIFSTIGERNKNGRIYPSHLWEREVKSYQDVLETGASSSLMELNHPPRADVNMMEAVAKISKLYVSDDKKYVMGEAFLLENPQANQLKTLIDAGIKMSVSSRGLGKVGATGLVEDFKLVTYDIIPDQGQSDHNAQMMGVVEGVLQGKEFEILENGCIGECELPSHDKKVNESLSVTKMEKIDDKPQSATLSDGKKVYFDNKEDKWIASSSQIKAIEKWLNEGSSELNNLKDLKAILEKYDAEILCDLDKETKEKVLEEFRGNAVSESTNDKKYDDLVAEVKKYEDYAQSEFTRLQEETIAIKEEAEKAYKKFFDAKLEKYGVSSPAELSDEQKKKFFDEIEKEWTGETNESLTEGNKEEYEKFFNSKLEKYGVSSPDELSDEQKKKFFDEIEKEWTSETNESKDKATIAKETLELFKTLK